MKEILRKTIRELIWSVVKSAFEGRFTDILRKGGHDIPTAKEKLKEARRALDRGDYREAFEDVAAARFYIMETDAHTKPLVDDTFDPLMDTLWELWQHSEGKEKSWFERRVARAKKLIDRMEELIDNPRGRKANPPTRVKTVRDARLWEMAKRTVLDQYKGLDEEDEEKYWAIVSRVFTRMKIRAGGRPEKEVEEAVRYLQEKYGEVVPATEKRKKELEEKVWEED